MMTPLLGIVPGLQWTRVARRRIDCPLVFFPMVALAAQPATTARGAGGGRAGSQENLKLAFEQGLGEEVWVVGGERVGEDAAIYTTVRIHAWLCTYVYVMCACPCVATCMHM